MTSSVPSSCCRMISRIGLLHLLATSDRKPLGNTFFFQACAYLIVRKRVSALRSLGGRGGGGAAVMPCYVPIMQ